MNTVQIRPFIYLFFFGKVLLFHIPLMAQDGLKSMLDSAVEHKRAHAVAHKKEIKPGAAVSLASVNLVTIDANQTSEIIVLLKAQSAIGTIHVETNTSEGLELISSAVAQDLSLNQDGYYQLPVSILAPRNGRYYLNLQVTINNDEYISSRVLAVIIQVGPLTDAINLPPRMLKSTTNENVISLPAQEKIIQH